jgi:hypothetical protein
MQIKEALNALNDGHTIWKVGYAKRVCEAFGIPFDEEELVWEFHRKDGYILKDEKDCLGVDGENLSNYVAKQLGVEKKAKSFIGCGSQAREYARVIREELKRSGKI